MDFCCGGSKPVEEKAAVPPEVAVDIPDGIAPTAEAVKPPVEEVVAEVAKPEAPVEVEAVKPEAVDVEAAVGDAPEATKEGDRGFMSHVVGAISGVFNRGGDKEAEVVKDDEDKEDKE